MLRRTLSATVLVATLLPAIVARADDVVIGASLPLSGALASFGSFQRWGYERAVAEANKSDAAQKVGAAIAKILLAKGITKIVFDRNGFLYHGRIRALADAARAAGLKF